MPEAERADEGRVLQFLRACDFDTAKAFEQWTADVKWRRENKVDEVLKGEPLPAARMPLLKALIPCAYHGVDKAGRPLYFAKTGDVDVDLLLHSLSDAELLQAHVWGMEYSIERARKSSAALGRRIDTFSTVVDMAGSGSSQKKLMNFAQMFATLDEQHYPSTLGFCVILNTPWFLKTLFAIISPFLTAATRSKITMLGSDYRDELAALIDADQMPTEYGGTCEGIRLTPNPLLSGEAEAVAAARPLGVCCGNVPCISIASKHELEAARVEFELPHTARANTAMRLIEVRLRSSNQVVKHCNQDPFDSTEKIKSQRPVKIWEIGLAQPVLCISHDMRDYDH
jgi:hypothetical protein